MTQTNQTIPASPLLTVDEHLAQAQLPELRPINLYAERGSQGLFQRPESSSAPGSSSAPLLSNIPYIPSEIWREIFSWYAILWCTFRSSAPSTDAWALGQVCQQWRDLALAMPNLWSHLPTIHIPPKVLKSDRSGRHWEEVLFRSGSLPLKLHFSFEISVNGMERLRGFLIPFFNHAERWEHLTVSGLTVMQTQAQFVWVYDRFSLLRSTTFNFEPTSDFPPSLPFNAFEKAPKLAEINLRSPSPADRKSGLRFPWAQLTSYRESGIDMGTFPFVVNLSAGLETLEYRGRNFTYRFVEGIVQFRLRHLIIEVKELGNFWRQLDCLTLPSLETFSVRVLQLTLLSRPPRISVLTNLIVRSGCSLKTLVLDFRPRPTKGLELVNLFSKTSDLESLELGGFHGPTFFSDVLPSFVYSQDNTTLLPRLQYFTLNDREEFEFPDFRVYPDFSTISDIVLSRERIALDNTDPGQLLATLKHARITTPKIHDLHATMHQLLGRVPALIPQPLLATSPTAGLSFEAHITDLLKRVRKEYQHVENCDQEPTSELLSLFLLACFIGDTGSRRETFEELEKLGVLSTVKSYLLRHRWIPGRDADILYVHPDYYDAAAIPEIWDLMNTTNSSRFESFGYRLSKEPEDDLMGVEDLP